MRHGLIKGGKNMVKARAAGAEENDLKVLVPEIVTWKIGDQEFTQSPATLDQLANTMDVIVKRTSETTSRTWSIRNHPLPLATNARTH